MAALENVAACRRHFSGELEETSTFAWALLPLPRATCVTQAKTPRSATCRSTREREP